MNDLRYFLKAICGVSYKHELLLAPTKEIIDDYKKRRAAWSSYEKAFFALMAARQVETRLPRRIFDSPTVLLCSERTAERCHRRLVVEYLQSKWGDIEVVHI